MSNNIEVNIGSCWMILSLDKETSLPAIFISEIEFFNKTENSIKMRGQLSEVLRYFNEIDERDIKDVICQVKLNPQWIQNMVKMILSRAGVIQNYDTEYWNINVCKEDIECIFESYPHIPDRKKFHRNKPNDINSVFEIDRTPLNKSEIYSRFLEYLLGSNCSHQCQLCGIHSAEELKTFIKKLDALGPAPTIFPFSTIEEIDENVWLYLQGHESDKIEQVLSENGCSCEIITGPNNSKQLKILSVQDNSDIDEAMNTIIEMYQGYALQNVIAEDMIIKESKEYEFAKKYVNDKKMYGRCSYKVCGPKSDLSELKTKFESRDNKKNEKKGKRKNDVKVEHSFESGLKISISKGGSFLNKVNDSTTLTDLSKKPRKEAQKDVDNEKAVTSIGPSTKSKEKDKTEDICAICMDFITHPEELKCGHAFCTDCLKEYNKRCSPKCPTCGMIYGEVRGNQPPGQMDINKWYTGLPGYQGCGHLEIVYNIWSGTQNEIHPNPGRPFRGIRRTAYLPDNEEGREVAKMLRRAFDNRLIFTIGRSQTTGLEDAVVWNDIHHKTAKHGDRYAYPDPEYLKRVKEELAAKGIYPEGQGKK